MLSRAVANVQTAVTTEGGPRHRVVCSLGSLSPGAKARWLKTCAPSPGLLSGQEQAGFGQKTRILTQIMTLKRLVEPSSELAMSD